MGDRVLYAMLTRGLVGTTESPSFDDKCGEVRISKLGSMHLSERQTGRLDTYVYLVYSDSILATDTVQGLEQSSEDDPLELGSAIVVQRMYFRLAQFQIKIEAAPFSDSHLERHGI